MRHIVFARPEQLHRHADLFGDVAHFDHVVVGEAASEGPARAQQVNRDVVFRNAQSLRDVSAVRERAAGVVLQISSLPSLKCALQFRGSSGA